MPESVANLRRIASSCAANVTVAHFGDKPPKVASSVVEPSGFIGAGANAIRKDICRRSCRHQKGLRPAL